MVEMSDHAAASGETAVDDAGAVRINLPAVVAPKLGAGADQTGSGAADQPKQIKTAAAPVVFRNCRRVKGFPGRTEV